MDGTGEHYARWNKPDGEGQIPYDLTFNWNIINRRKKQTKYNQRHWSGVKFLKPFDYDMEQSKGVEIERE